MQKNKLFSIIPFLLVLLAAMSACESNLQNNNTSNPKDIHFDVLVKNSNSEVQDKNYFVIKNEQEYLELQSKFKELRNAQVNFSTDYIIAVFQGQKNTGGYGISINKIVDEGESMAVYVQESSPGGGCMVTMALTSPYSIVKIPKTDKKIIFKTKYNATKCR